ncbi:MAG TPA: hypothetical protein VH678_03915 [Xanthobacteraceae bacterium]|jgi:hypothetical protein
MTREELAAAIERECETFRKEYAVAKKLRASHPTVSWRLREAALWELATRKELLRRLPTMKPETIQRLKTYVQHQRKKEKQLRGLSNADLAKGYQQEIWRDHDLMKAAKADGIDLRQLSALLVDGRMKEAPTEPQPQAR